MSIVDISLRPRRRRKDAVVYRSAVKTNSAYADCGAIWKLCCSSSLGRSHSAYTLLASPMAGHYVRANMTSSTKPKICGVPQRR